MKTKVSQKFAELYGEEYILFTSPGRINLIGEHTDYNGGHVFPCAISLGTYALVALRQDMKTRAISLNYEKDGIKEFSMENLSYDESIGWANYIAGAVSGFLLYGAVDWGWCGIMGAICAAGGGAAGTVGVGNRKRRR